MKSPFPGMDPYIESRGLWDDFHSGLVAEIHRTLADVVPEPYVVRSGERAYLTLEDPRGQEKRRFQPDVGVLSDPDYTLSSSRSSVAVVDTDPVIMTALVEVEHRETFVEIRTLDSERSLVTCIEILSPTNKRHGSSGWELYNRKRHGLIQGGANLVEIDLLRRGRRMPMEEAWPASPYALLVCRKEEAPKCQVWPASFRAPIPKIPVPLAHPDPDVALDLQPLIATVYARSRYERDIDYRQPPNPPLGTDDWSWLQQRLTDATQAH